MIALIAKSVDVVAGPDALPTLLATTKSGRTLALSIPDRFMAGHLGGALLSHLRQTAPAGSARAGVVGQSTTTALVLNCDEAMPAISGNHEPVLALRFGELWMQIPFPEKGLTPLIDGLSKLREALASGSKRSQ